MIMSNFVTCASERLDTLVGGSGQAAARGGDYPYKVILVDELKVVVLVKCQVLAKEKSP